jgi:hypothetical protein
MTYDWKAKEEAQQEVRDRYAKLEQLKLEHDEMEAALERYNRRMVRLYTVILVALVLLTALKIYKAFLGGP